MGPRFFRQRGQVIKKAGVGVAFFADNKGVAVQMSLQLFTIQPTLIRFERRREAKRASNRVW